MTRKNPTEPISGEGGGKLKRLAATCIEGVDRVRYFMKLLYLVDLRNPGVASIENGGLIDFKKVPITWIGRRAEKGTNRHRTNRLAEEPWENNTLVFLT